MKHYNAKPSKHGNLGEDIQGAQRHAFDTYENPEKKAAREQAKKIKNNTKELKTKAIMALNEENFLQVIHDYEFKRALINFEGYNGPKEKCNDEAMQSLMDYVKSKRGDESFSLMRDKFNRLSRLLRRLRYRVRNLEDAKAYFEKKKVNKFTEVNGIQKIWSLDHAFNPLSTQYLSKEVKAVQFGNSLSESEREYCLDNLMRAIKTLNAHFNFNFQSIGFSYGARGKAGSIAHYENKRKVLAFNRGWDGALIHELGHAIDYSLDLPSWKMPREIFTEYREKLTSIENLDRKAFRYYMEPKEVFARLFEVWCRKHIQGLTEFMQFTFNEDIMPELDAQAEEFMNEVLKPIIKKEQ